MPSTEGGRSGCALASGVFFIALGGLLLAQNLTEFRLLDYADQAAAIFVRYWPVALILWGVYKVYRRMATPERSRVSGSEVLALVLLVAFGLAVSAARDALARLRGSELGGELAAVLGPDLLGPTHRFREESLFELEPGAPLVVENRFGGLRAVGSDRTDLRIVVERRVRGASEDEARELAARLRLELVGGVARVVGDDAGSAAADLEIELPRGTPLVARIPEGRVAVLGLDAAVRIEAGDEDVSAERLGSTLAVETRHGDVRIGPVAGDATVESRHGSIRARELGGSLRAGTERGSIVAEEVEGAVELSNRSGSLRVAGAGGTVTIDATHTSVEVERASGDVVVASSDRSIFVRGVGGSLRVEARNARVEIREVRGPVVVDDALQPVRVVGVEGALTVRSKNGTVVAEELSGPVEIEATSEDVHVARFRSSLTARAEHGSLFAETEALGGDVELRTTYGDIELFLPASASFRLEARSGEGELHSDGFVTHLEPSSEDGGRVYRGESEGGRYRVRVRTDYGDLLLKGDLR